MLPTILDAWAKVAADPKAQYTFLSYAPLIKMKLVAVALIKVDPVWKIHWAFGSLLPSRVTDDADRNIELLEQ